MNGIQTLVQLAKWFSRREIPQEPLCASIHVTAPSEIERVRRFPIQLRLENQGTESWHSRGPCRVVLLTRWLDHHRRLILDGDQYAIRHLRPGQQRAQTLTIPSPPYLGDLILEVELRRMNACNLDNQGTLQRHAIRVNDPPARDIDYVEWYRRENLEKNHWQIVGPQTLEEHTKIQQAQLQILQDEGLTCECSILDVGCGTGKLAEALIPVLSRGQYVGTDIGREAIQFCEKRWKHEQFTFLCSEPTMIPIREERFDFIVFFSVFTHTYLEETESLLADASRLLQPHGRILADVFLSELTLDCVGRRGAIELNEERFLEVVGRQKLRAERIDSLCHPWHRFAQRAFYRLKPQHD